METQDGLPKVEGLEGVAADILSQPTGQSPQQAAQQAVEGAVQGQEPPVESGETVDPELQKILQTFSTPDGKVRTKDLLKSYKEIQGFTTRVSQDNAALKAEIQKFREEMQVRNYQAPQAPPIPDQKTFDQMFIENPQAAIEQVATAKAYEIANTQRIAEVLEAEEANDPKEFNERVAYVKMMAQNPQYQPYTRSPQGVKLLFAKADEYRKEALQARAHESLKILFGDDFDLEKLKAIARKDGSPQPNTPQPNSNAYMPNQTGSSMTGADLNLNQNGLRASREAALQRGDAGSVAGALLREALLKK